MFYLTTHSTHFIYGYMVERERNVLFNDALNTFYLRLYGRERNVLFNDALNTFYLRSDIWLKTILIVRKETRCRHIGRGTDFPRSRNRGRNRGKAYLKRNSRFSAKTLLVTFKKHTLLSKRTFQHHFENRNSRYLTTLIFVSVTPN